jgi:hypothetical protein
MSGHGNAKDVSADTLPEMNVQAQARVFNALSTLDFYKYDTKELWRAFEARTKAKDTGLPTEDQLRYTTPTAPPSLAGHVVDGMPQPISAHVIWKGYHYSLTPGQRRWFRENEDMTPARTVTVVWVECWPGTNALKAFKIESDLHVDPQHRMHVLTAYVIRNATRFFDESAKYDREEVDANTLSLTIGKVNVWNARHAWAVKDMTNRKLIGQVSIVFLDDQQIDFQDTAGNHIAVDRKTFLSTVADYVRLYDTDSLGRRIPGGKAKTRSTNVKGGTTIEDLMKEMQNDLGVEV